MTSIGLKLEKKDKALILLSSFPSSYEHPMTTLFYVNDSIDLEEVIATLLLNKVRKNDSINEVQAEGLVTHGTTKMKRLVDFRRI